MSNLAPLSSAWLKVGKERIPVQVETRRGGVYQIELLEKVNGLFKGTRQFRLVQRSQLVARR